MRPHRINCLYHPTTVMFVDDNQRFLDSTLLKLSDKIPCKSYEDPLVALRYLLSLDYQTDLSAKVFALDADSDHYYPSSGKHPLNINISGIQQELYNKARFKQVSVAIVDYEMPPMKGSDFFQQILHLPIKKILLTGEAGESRAVELFNQGIIDTFILKGAQNLYKTVADSIFALQRKYFEELTKPIFKGLETEQGFCLANPAFIDLFEQVYTEVTACSYYLLEASGSFLFLDAKGTPSWLLVKTENDLNDYLDMAIDSGASETVISALKSKKSILYFNNFNEYSDAIDGHWVDYLYPAKTLALSPDKKCFYALVKQIKNSSLKHDEILSFDAFMQNQNL